MKKINDRMGYLNSVREVLPENPTCMEIGVYKGEFSQQLLEHLKPKKLYLVDPFDNIPDEISGLDFYPSEILTNHRTIYSNMENYTEVSSRMKNQIDTGQVIVVKETSYNATQRFEDESFDFIYIDAVHLYESVKWDLENYYPKVNKGGIIGGHDYSENFPGVIQAVDEFCEKMGLEIYCLSDYSDFFLSKK